MKPTLARTIPAIAAASIFWACDVGTPQSGGNRDAGGPRSPDSGESSDTGARPDAGDVCDFVGCDCATVQCAVGLTCATDHRCVRPPSCYALGLECEFDDECCPAADPRLGTWCGVDSVCVQCSALDGRCTSDYDCCPVPEPALMCNSRGVCKPVCQKDTECPGGETCLLSGECVPIPCSGDSQCPDEHCCSGTCKPDCGYGPPEACAITTPGGVTFKDQTKKLHAIAWKGDAKKGAQMVPWTEFEWSSSRPEIASVDAATGEVIGGDIGGQAKIFATSGGIDCGSVVVANHLPVTDDSFRVIVYDAETGAPVEGADIAIGSNPPVKTDSGGVAIATSPPADVHVFHDGHTWVSLVGVGLSDYVVYLKPKPDDTVAGGYRGKFDFSDEPRGYQFGRACTSSTGHVWDAPLAVAGSFFFMDVGPDLRCDELIRTHIRLSTNEGSFMDYDNWDPTAGGFMANQQRIGATNLVPSYRVLGKRGPRAAWAIAGGLPSSDADLLFRILTTHPDPIATYESELQPGVIGVLMLRFLQNLGHAVTSVFVVAPLPKISTPLADDGNPLVSSPTMADYASFPEIDLKPANRLALKTIIDLPGLPNLQGRCLGGLYVEGRTVLPGMGAVTLGKNGGLDNLDDPSRPDDCVATAPDLGFGSEDVTDGQIALRMAPNHDGLETNPYQVALLASEFSRSIVPEDRGSYDLPFNAWVGGASQSLSGRIIDLGPVVPREMNVPPFLSLPEGAVFDSTARAIAAPPQTIAGSVAYRYTLKNADGEWEVYTDSSVASIVIPTPPAGYADRAADAAVTVHAFSTRGALLAGMFSPASGGEIDVLGKQVDAFSRLTCLKKIPLDDPDYTARCEPANPDKVEEACNPACEVR